MNLSNNSDNLLSLLVVNKIENMDEQGNNVNGSSTNGNLDSHDHTADYEMRHEGHNSHESEASEDIRWLEYPLVLESYKSRFYLPDMNNSEQVKHLKNLNLWVRTYKYLDIETQNRHSSSYFFDPSRIDGGWKFRNIKRNNTGALKIPVSQLLHLDFDNNPMLLWDVNAMATKT